MNEQLGFFNTNAETVNKKKRSEGKNWFDAALKLLKVKDVPAWPDHFGERFKNLFEDMNNSPIRTVSLFAGGGGLDIGFHDMGFDVLEMVEIEDKFCESLRQNSKTDGYFNNSPTVISKDIRRYVPGVKKVDFVIGGPPCQTFSAAGRRAAGVQGVDDPRGTLFEEYIRVLQLLKPKGFLFENVYGIIGAQGGEAWQQIVSRFQEIGYKLSYRILDTADYGVPQHRERLIIVGVLNGTFRFPRPTHGPDSADNKNYYTAGKALADLKLLEDEKTLGGRFGHLLKGIPPGLNYSFYTSEMGHPEPVFAWRSKFSDFLYKADPEKPVRTIKAQGGQYTGPFSWHNRKFSTAEHKRLQTFPDNYILSGGKQIAVKQIGNSVPPQFARILALSILDQIFHIKLPFEISYLNPNEELGFRQRKRNLTKHYQSEATKAINRIDQADAKKIIGFDKKNYIRYLNPQNFRWNEQSLSANDLKFKIFLTGADDKKVIKISSNLKDEGYVFKINIQSREENALKGDIEIRLQNKSDLTITAGFKAAEELISSHMGMADLVQLSGYYQYQPKISVRFSDEKRNTSENQSFIGFIKEIIQSGCVAQQLPAQEFAIRTGFKKPKVIEYLKRMKRMGYEVRNSNTNPQISDDEYLVPYAFPSLTPVSVQLRKEL